MLRRLCEGESDSQKLALLARGRLKKKQDELKRALRERLTTAQKFILRELLDRYEELERAIARVNQELTLSI